MALLWRLCQANAPSPSAAAAAGQQLPPGITILGTDVDADVIKMAESATYEKGKLSELPERMAKAFDRLGPEDCPDRQQRGQADAAAATAAAAAAAAAAADACGSENAAGGSTRGTKAMLSGRLPLWQGFIRETHSIVAARLARVVTRPTVAEQGLGGIIK
jgi:hypothetical protein